MCSNVRLFNRGSLFFGLLQWFDKKAIMYSQRHFMCGSNFYETDVTSTPLCPLLNAGATKVASMAAQSVVFGKMAIFCYSPALYTKLISSIICGFSDHYDHYEKKFCNVYTPCIGLLYVNLSFNILWNIFLENCLKIIYSL